MYFGAGYQQASVEDEDTPTTQYEDAVATFSAFVNFKYYIMKGFYIQPEVSYFDYGKNKEKGGGDYGEDILVGVHFEYDF